MFDQMLVDLTDVEVKEHTLLPKGDYPSKAISAEVKDTASGTGTYLQVNFRVLNGAFEGSFFTDRFNLTNPNPTAVKIGHERLKKFMIAAKKTDFVLRSPEELLDLKALVSIDIRKRDGYKDINDVKNYSKLINLDGDQDEIPF